MKVYIPDEHECQEATPGLVPAPLRKAFNDAQVPKDPMGPTPGWPISRTCDGYYFGLTSMAGSRFRLAGVDWTLLTFAGIFSFILFMFYYHDGVEALSPFPSVNEEYILTVLLWSILFFFFFMGLWVHHLAKKDAMSVIIFNRERGTVTFPKIANREGLTVPFEDVDLAVADTKHSHGGRTWQASIRTRTCRPGHPPREELVVIYGLTKEEYLQEWNMICRFMDRSMPIPACLHKIIGNNQREGIDLWEKPYPEGRIFDPPLDEREFPPEAEATLKELEELLREDGMSESEIQSYIETVKNKHRVNNGKGVSAT